MQHQKKQNLKITWFKDSALIFKKRRHNKSYNENLNIYFYFYEKKNCNRFIINTR